MANLEYIYMEVARSDQLNFEMVVQIKIGMTI